MGTTWSQWGITAAGVVDLLYTAIPYATAPEHWTDATFPAQSKIRARFYVDHPGGAVSFNADSKVDGEWLNFIETNVTAIQDDWDSIWANAGETDDWPTGYPMQIPDMSPEKTPRYKAARVAAYFSHNTVICYGMGFGIVNDNVYSASAYVFERTPRSGASKTYDTYHALCSYTATISLISAINKLVESARWMVTGPIMGDR